jgi:hypothetical protein
LKGILLTRLSQRALQVERGGVLLKAAFTHELPVSYVHHQAMWQMLGAAIGFVG